VTAIVQGSRDTREQMGAAAILGWSSSIALAFPAPSPSV
jgi:hypothetical protein